MNWALVGIVGFVVALALMYLYEVRRFKRYRLERRIENAKAKGMTLEQYENWLIEVDPKNQWPDSPAPPGMTEIPLDHEIWSHSSDWKRNRNVSA